MLLVAVIAWCGGEIENDFTRCGVLAVYLNNNTVSHNCHKKMNETHGVCSRNGTLLQPAQLAIQPVEGSLAFIALGGSCQMEYLFLSSKSYHDANYMIEFL